MELRTESRSSGFDASILVAAPTFIVFFLLLFQVCFMCSFVSGFLLKHYIQFSLDYGEGFLQNAVSVG